MNKRQTAGLRADNYLLIVVTVKKIHRDGATARWVKKIRCIRQITGISRLSQHGYMSHAAPPRSSLT